MSVYVVASCKRIKLLFSRGRDEEFWRGPESDRSEEPKFSGSGRLQINDDFLLRDDHFGALLAAGKPEADLTDFRTLPEPTRGRWRPNHCNSWLNRTISPMAAAKPVQFLTKPHMDTCDGAQTIAIPG